MKACDTYKTLEAPSTGIYKEKGSRFIAFALPVSSVEDVKSKIDDFRKKYHDARHHCYAYMLGFERKEWRANDDGEPSGTGGRPILGQINSFGLTNTLIIVIRYFGGTLLGTSGLINAYKTAAYEAIKSSAIIECTVKETYLIRFPYSSMNGVMKILKDEDVSQSNQKFELECSVRISFRLSSKEAVMKKLSGIDRVTLTYLETV